MNSLNINNKGKLGFNLYNNANNANNLNLLSKSNQKCNEKSNQKSNQKSIQKSIQMSLKKSSKKPSEFKKSNKKRLVGLSNFSYVFDDVGYADDKSKNYKLQDSIRKINFNDDISVESDFSNCGRNQKKRDSFISKTNTSTVTSNASVTTKNKDMKIFNFCNDILSSK